MSKVAIVGSRDYPRLDRVREYVTGLPAETVVVSGGARGVDRTAQRAAEERGLSIQVWPALWDAHGKRAGYLRNRLIVETADRIVAFWDGQSKGTKHTIDLAIAAGKPVEVLG